MRGACRGTPSSLWRDGLRRLLCLLMALSLLSGPAALALGNPYPDKEHLPVDYAGMLPVTGFDETALLAALEELENVCGRHTRRGAEPETRRRVQALYDRILEEVNVLVTKAALADIQYDANGGADGDLCLELSAQETRLFDRCYQAFGVLAASPYRDVLDSSAGEGAAQSVLGYRGLSEEDAALRDEEDRLIQSYNEIMAGDPADGGTRDRAAGEVYRQMLQLRTEIAAQAGYDSYAAYAYEIVYHRDYTLEDAQALREAVKTRVLPLYLRLSEEIRAEDLRALSVRSRKSGEEMLDDIRPFVYDFSREMGKTFDFMREHHLYDVEYREEKLPTGYTVDLPAYGSAFIFLSPYGDFWDYGDLVHEFGHFNETFHSAQHVLWSDFNIDVGEIDSQALALIFTGWAGEIFGPRYEEAYAQAALYGVLDSILTGCLYDEFQETAFRSPDVSVEELNRLYKRLSEEYGAVYEPGVEEDSSWVEVSHSFQNPMYIISYATSGLSALDLWFLYLDSPRRGRDAYLELSALSLSLPYRGAMGETGLPDVFAPETVPALAEQLENFMNGEPVSHTGSRRSGETQMVLCVFGLAALVLVLGLRARPSRKERAESRRRESLAPWSPRQEGEEPRRSGEDPWSVREKKPPWEM